MKIHMIMTNSVTVIIQEIYVEMPNKKMRMEIEINHALKQCKRAKLQFRFT